MVITCEHEAASSALPGTFELRNGKKIRPVGLVLEGPQYAKLVRCGIAEPADDECAALFTSDQIAASKIHGHPGLMQRLNERVQEQRDMEADQHVFDMEDDD